MQAAIIDYPVSVYSLVHQTHYSRWVWCVYTLSLESASLLYIGRKDDQNKDRYVHGRMKKHHAWKEDSRANIASWTDNIINTALYGTQHGGLQESMQ